MERFDPPRNNMFHMAGDESGRRWRLVLGESETDQEPGDDSEQPGGGSPGESPHLSEDEMAIDGALDAIYGDSAKGDLSASKPDIARHLGDIREYFPESVVRVMQQDVVRRLNPRQLVQHPELLAEVEPDAALAASLISLRKTMPAKTHDTARLVVARVVQDLIKKLEFPLRQAVTGSLNRAARTTKPKNLTEINFHRTIYANLRHFQPEERTVIPEKLIGYGRRRATLRDVILLIDTSGSMANSVVYAGVAAAILASIPALAIRLVMFDTNVVDLTDQIVDPVELLFGLRLGGGTHIDKALAYCQGAITRPKDTVVILITDLFEGGNKDQMLRRAAALVESGVRVITLLALSDQGVPRFNATIAGQLAQLGVPSLACTPDKFPEVMSAALSGRDLTGFMPQ